MKDLIKKILKEETELNKINLMFDNDLDHNEDLCDKFIRFASDYLELEGDVKVDILSKREKGMTTANFNNETYQIKVYGKGRALVDILRSVAHEMVHHKQMEEGRIKPNSGDTGSPIENEANSKAGVLMRIFSKQNPEVYD